ncbi:retrovirus-related Pol polyprotein from transposon 17.6 [Trichonephila clavipes]|nr:retrovirus-related Pol polyprotein from transposon 17.6 [Trichonephila clavipes]
MMIVQLRNDKVSNHGSIPITIDCNVVAFVVFEEGFHQPIKRTKQLSNTTETVSVSSADLEGQGLNRRVNLKDLMPKFETKNADINLFFEIFERHAKKERVFDDRWVSQLIPLLPVESNELVAKEPPEKGDDYPRIKKLILNRLQLTPVALRDRKLVVRNGNKRFEGVKRIVSDQTIKKRAPIEVVDHFVDSWDNFKDATELAEKLDHFEAVKKVHRKPNTLKLGEREQFDRQPVADNKGTSQIRGSEREWKRSSERKKTIICYYCNEVGHIKPACPKLMKTDFETVASLRVNSEDEDCFETFKFKFERKGVERQCLRDTGSNIDMCASSWIDENDYLGEYVLVKSSLDDVCHRLPFAKVKFKIKAGQFYTKAAVKVNSHPSEPYLLSNRTSELIQSREKSVLMIDAMVTRNASKIVPFERKGKQV